MLIARVLGPLWATVQERHFKGAKLLLTQPIDAQTGEPFGTEVLAVDVVNAGAGDLVLIVYEGSSSRLSLGNERSCAEAVIVGIIDAMDVPAAAPRPESAPVQPTPTPLPDPVRPQQPAPQQAR